MILITALVLDRIIGDPEHVWRHLPHPVVLFGRAIGFFDRTINQDGDFPATSRRKGILVLLFLLILSILIGLLLSFLFDRLGWVGFIAEIIIVAVFLAQRSLSEHVSAVASGLMSGGVDGGRLAVARIVGRDPESLDEEGVSRAAIESLAENFADGVVAPAFWFVVLGLPGLLAYKMLNTADSMIGHKSDRHLDFGWAAARLDDVANWPAARLSAMFIVIGAFFEIGTAAAKRGLQAALRDAGLHRSPNAGWPECAMAGALRLSVAGERNYAGVVVREPRLNAAGRHAATGTDIKRAIRLYEVTCNVLVAVLFALLIITLILP
ncbi:MAG: adenosylcobinamide-phosphate synthase CbiB [Alphaproteobacteria bacterium]|nr:adenosylcobinamide-phosphate synthase CbiB [Alphaproteobacteria bacterium]